MADLKTATTGFPGAIDTCTAEVDNVDTARAAVPNNYMSAILAIENLLGANGLNFFKGDVQTSAYTASRTSAALTANVWTSMGTPITFAFTPVYTGTYKLHFRAPFGASATARYAGMKIIKNAGTGTLVVADIYVRDLADSIRYLVADCEAIVTLTAGTSFTAEIQVVGNTGGETVTIDGSLANYPGLWSAVRVA